MENAFVHGLPRELFAQLLVKDKARFKLFNKAGQNLLGVTSEQIIGKSDYDLFSKEQADFFAKKYKEVFRKHEVLRIEQEPIETPRGQRLLQTFKVPTYGPDGSPDLLIGISRDITEEVTLLRALEEERAKSLHSAKLASLGEMAAGVAHEINNPLATIVVTVPLMSRHTDNPEKFQAKVNTVLKAAGRIEKIVKGLRKFSRISEGEIYKTEDLASIVEEALVITEAKAKRLSVPIEACISEGMSVHCDGVEIDQVLVNLINNSIDAVKNSKEK